MKNTLIYTIALFGLLFSSCEKDEDRVTVNGANNEPIVLELESPVYLDENYPDNPAMTLNWSYVDYGQELVVHYKVEFSADNVFTAPIEAVTTDWRTYTWSVSNINEIATGALMLPPNEPSTLYARVLASIGDNGTYEVASNILEIPITPFATYLFDDWHLVGDATAPGWNNGNNNPPLVRDPENENVYSYTGYFTANHFKIIQVLGQWAPMYGTNNGSDETTDMVFRATEGDPDPGTWQPPVDGYYTYTFDLGELEATRVAFDANESPVYGSIGIIGSATANGWDSDQDMTQSTFDQHVWYIESISLGGGEAKFRADDDWTDNWGGDTTYSGTATSNGPNIPVISGTYKVWFYDLTGQYMFIPIEE